MGPRHASRTVRGWLLVAIFVAVTCVGGRGFAEDYEDPIDPEPPIGNWLTFGGLTVETEDLSVPAIDARAALAPQLTALLIMGELGDGEGETASVSTSPVLSWWVTSIDEGQ